MKKLVGLIFLMTISTSNIYSQKLYVWCQKEQIPTPRKNFLQNQEIDLVLFDSRTMTDNSKIECSSEEVVRNLIDLIKDTYPDANFNVLESDKFYQNPEPNKITIKIAISAFQAAFGADVKIGIGNIGGSFAWGVFPEGKWNAITGYSVMIYNYKNGNKNKITEQFGKMASRPNTGGYRTAKNMLNKSYIEANQEMFSFIDRTLME